MNRVRLRAVRTTVCMMALSSCASAGSSRPRPPDRDSGRLDAAHSELTTALRAYVDSGRLPGIRAVVVRRGEVIYEESIGWSDVERRIPMGRDAIFRIYSMTKPVLAAGVLKLIDQGKMSLEDPVAGFIPAFADAKVYAGGPSVDPVLADPDTVMTIRHLLTHTAGLGYGIQDGPVDTLYRQAALFDPQRTVEQFADSIARLPLYFSPGTRFQYSAAIDVLGRVIEVASGEPLDRFLEEEIFQPLGMHGTSFRLREDMKERLTVLYAPDGGGGLKEVVDELSLMYEPEARFVWGGGGLLSTTHDYLRFAQMLLNGGELDGRRILSDESVKRMMSNYLPPALTPLSGPPLMDEGYGYGLGGAVLVDAAVASLPGPAGIYRWSGYVGTYFWIDPVNDLIGMVWTQLTPGRTYPLERDFQRLVYTALSR